MAYKREMEDFQTITKLKEDLKKLDTELYQREVIVFVEPEMEQTKISELQEAFGSDTESELLTQFGYMNVYRVYNF